MSKLATCHQFIYRICVVNTLFPFILRKTYACQRLIFKKKRRLFKQLLLFVECVVFGYYEWNIVRFFSVASAEQFSIRVWYMPLHMQQQYFVRVAVISIQSSWSWKSVALFLRCRVFVASFFLLLCWRCLWCWVY